MTACNPDFAMGKEGDLEPSQTREPSALTEPGLRLVNIESPFAGGGERALRYARACMRDSISRGEAPIASHLLYTQPGILDDEDMEERELGIMCGFSWNRHARATVVYTDLGISGGMRAGIHVANIAGRPIEYRTLPEWKLEAAGPGSPASRNNPLPPDSEVAP